MAERPKDQCRFQSHFGQCRLRGSIGHASADGGGMYCPLHARVTFGESVWLNEVAHPARNSKDFLEVLVQIEKKAGIERWNKKTIDQWWELASGGNTPAPRPYNELREED